MSKLRQSNIQRAYEDYNAALAENKEMTSIASSGGITTGIQWWEHFIGSPLTLRVANYKDI